jgi:hypothetical protein
MTAPSPDDWGLDSRIHRFASCHSDPSANTRHLHTQVCRFMYAFTVFPNH